MDLQMQIREKIHAAKTKQKEKRLSKAAVRAQMARGCEHGARNGCFSAEEMCISAEEMCIWRARGLVA